MDDQSSYFCINFFIDLGPSRVTAFGWQIYKCDSWETPFHFCCPGLLGATSSIDRSQQVLEFLGLGAFDEKHQEEILRSD